MTIFVIFLWNVCSETSWPPVMMHETALNMVGGTVNHSHLIWVKQLEHTFICSQELLRKHCVNVCILYWPAKADVICQLNLYIFRFHPFPVLHCSVLAFCPLLSCLHSTYSTGKTSTARRGLHFVHLHCAHESQHLFIWKETFDWVMFSPFHGNAELHLILHGHGRVVGKATQQYIFLHVGPVRVVTFTGCQPAVKLQTFE